MGKDDLQVWVWELLWWKLIGLKAGSEELLDLFVFVCIVSFSD